MLVGKKMENWVCGPSLSNNIGGLLGGWVGWFVLLRSGAISADDLHNRALAQIVINRF